MRAQGGSEGLPKRTTTPALCFPGGQGVPTWECSLPLRTFQNPGSQPCLPQGGSTQLGLVVPAPEQEVVR